MSSAAEAGGDDRVHVVGTLADFPEGQHRVVEVGGRRIGVFHLDGRLHGLPNVCPHQAGPLCEAKHLTGTLDAAAERDWEFEWILDGEVLVCPWHGLEFEAATGRCLAYGDIRLRRYEVFADGDVVKVRL